MAYFTQFPVSLSLKHARNRVKSGLLAVLKICNQLTTRENIFFLSSKLLAE